MLQFISTFLEKVYTDLPLYVCLVYFYIRFEARLSRIEGIISVCARPRQPASLGISDIDQ